ARGIRCCYHGWLFAADGAILETPGEPAENTLKDRLYHGAYPTHSYMWNGYIAGPAADAIMPIKPALFGASDELAAPGRALRAGEAPLTNRAERQCGPPY